MFIKSMIILALLASPALSLPKPKPNDEKHLEPKTDELKSNNKPLLSDEAALKKQEEPDSKLDAKVDDSSKNRIVDSPKGDYNKKDSSLEKEPEQSTKKTSEDEPKPEQQKGQQQELKDDEQSKLSEQNSNKPEQQKQEPQQLEEPIKQQSELSAKPDLPIKIESASNKNEQQQIKPDQPQQDLKEDEQQFEEQQQEQALLEESKPLPASKKGLNSGSSKSESLESQQPPKSPLAAAPRAASFQQDLIQAQNSLHSRKQALKARLFGTYIYGAPVVVEPGKQQQWIQQQFQQQPQQQQQQQILQQHQQQSQAPLLYSPYSAYYPYQPQHEYGYLNYHDYYQRPSVFSRLFGYMNPPQYASRDTYHPAPRYY